MLPTSQNPHGTEISKIKSGPVPSISGMSSPRNACKLAKSESHLRFWKYGDGQTSSKEDLMKIEDKGFTCRLKAMTHPKCAQTPCRGFIYIPLSNLSMETLSLIISKAHTDFCFEYRSALRANILCSPSPKCVSLGSTFSRDQRDPGFSQYY